MEEPDYDDLIEDFMEDAEEPPPAAGYDDDFLEEMEADAQEETTADQPPIPAADEVPSPSSPISRDLPNRLAAASSSFRPSTTTTNSTSEDAASPAAQVRSELAANRSRGGVTEPDIFSFERYQGQTAWREEAPASPSTMKAREWKSKHQRLVEAANSRNSNNSNSPNNHQSAMAKAPEMQLLHYQKASRQTLRPPQRISRHDKYFKTSPSEGHRNIPITLGDGTRLFVKVLEEEAGASKKTSASPKNILSYSLGVSMTDLLRRVQAVKRKKEHDRLKELSKELKQQRKKLTSTHDDVDEDDDADDADEEMEEATTTAESTVVDDQLWVDKHAPSTFANLLSDERTNREVLRALREWDPYVFKRDAPPRPQYFAQLQQEKDKDSQLQHQKQKNPNDKRPDERNRVILLSGSPGVGKTTLAHILARHCGYRPLEVNGSDERSAAALTDRVVRAMESATLNMQSSNHPAASKDTKNNWKGRPNCIIIDEVDGADAGKALQALVELIRQDMPTSTKGDNDKEGGKQVAKRQRNKPYLRRPIIFICNNLYAPALRPLLPYARRFEVEAPAPPRLVARLRAVLSAEGLSLWGGATMLHDLVSSSGGDIRSCLYTLQFASAQLHQSKNKQQDSKKQKDISYSLQAALKGDGMKDNRKDVSGTTMTVFRKTKNKGKNDRLWGTRQMSDPRTSVERVLDAVESLGEDAKILDCLYLNLYNVSYIDPTFDRCAAALQWLSGADRRGIQRLYTPCAAAALHLLCRVEQKPDLTYTTRELTDNRYQMEANLGLTHKFADGLSAHYHGSRSSDAIVKETVPYALWMLSAGEGSSALNRPASSMEILKKKELEAFVKHSETLKSLGLTYVASTEVNDGFSGEIRMILEPPIHRLVQFQFLNAGPMTQRKDIPSPMKELLARRSTLLGIRDLGASGVKAPRKVTSPLVKQGSKKDDKATSEKTKSPVSALVTPPLLDGKNKRNQATNQKDNVDDKERPLKKQKVAISSQNFLGVGAKRARDKKSARRAKNVGLVRSAGEKKSNTGSEIPFREVVRLKFIKGFTQAVRNPCRIEDLA